MADRQQSDTSNRGFASMDEDKQRDIARKGGHASGGNFRNDPDRAAEAGRSGGQSVPDEKRSFSQDHELAAEAGRKGGQSVSDEKRSFSQDHELAAEAGRKGGEHSHGGQTGHPGSGHRGGGGNFAEDRERAAEAGRKGGEHSHGRS
jgi:general stress protein YciG